MTERASRLWASEIGRCPRSIMLRILGFERTRDFPEIVKKAMQFGLDKEAETLEVLRENFGDRIVSQKAMGNDLWSGHPDFIVDCDTDDAIIVEHKGVFGRWRGLDLLSVEHVAQLCLYGQLHEETNNGKRRPSLILFYRGRSASLLFEVYPLARGGIDVFGIEALGESLTGILIDRINAFVPGDATIIRKNLDFDMWRLRADLESYYRVGELPPRLPVPEHRRCVWHGEPSCLMYDHCWPEAVTL